MPLHRRRANAAWARSFSEDFVRHTRTLQGFVALKDVCGKEKEDSIQSFLFAEIFKRYYLLFAPDKALDFDA